MKRSILILFLCSLSLGQYVHVNIPPGARSPVLPGDATVPATDATDATPLAFTASATGNITPTWTFSSGTVVVDVDGSPTSLTTATEAVIAVTAGQAVTVTASDPTAVTAIDMRYDRLTGDIDQLSQFINLASLNLWDSDPVSHIGSEALTNGNFAAWTGDDPDSWSVTEVGDATSNITESTGSCQIISNGTAASISQAILTDGVAYTVKVYVSAVTSGSVTVTLGSSGASQVVSAVGVTQFVGFCDGSTAFTVANTAACNLVIDWIEVKPITSLVTNGGMDADSDWDKSDAAVTIGSGVATWSGAQAGDANLSQASTSTQGSQYFGKYTITETAGVITPSLKGTEFIPRVLSGTYQEYVTAGSDPNLIFSGDAAFAGTLDNVLNVAWPDSSIGEIGDVTSLPLTSLTVTGSSSIAWTANAFDSMTGLKTLYIDGANWTAAEITAALASLKVADVAGMTGCTITFLNVPSPTDQGYADAMSIAADNTISIPPFAGFTYSGLVSYWPLTDTGATVADLYGSNTGTIVNATSAVDAERGRVLSFDGTGDYVSFSALTGSSGTMSAWIKTSNKIGNMTILSEGLSNNDAVFLIFLIRNDVGTGRFGAYEYIGGVRTVYSNTDIADGTWHHVACVSNGTAYALYIDGVSQALTITGANSGNWFSDLAGDTWSIGMLNRPTPYASFNGSLSEIMVFNRALSATEVKQLYEFGLP